MKITVIIPCFNEEKTINKIIEKINQLEIDKEIIVVDDCSDDNSLNLLEKLKKLKQINVLIKNEKNNGKGFCIKKAKDFISGDIIIIQDADLEYDPNDYFKLIEPIKNNITNVVYGSRVLKKNRYNNNNFISFIRIFANHFLTELSNIINKQNLTDAHTCYKVLRSDLFKKIHLCENGFSFCPEITTKLSNLNEKIIEVPISYIGRNYDEGKKIKISDGFKAILTLIKYKLQT